MSRYQNTKKRNGIFQIVRGVLLVLLVGSGLVVHHRFMIHPIAGTSMEEALHQGDYVVIRKHGPIRRYSVIAFSQENEMYIKRVIGQPGDELLVQKQTVVLDLGKKENYASTLRVQVSSEVAKELQGQTTIPEGCYFVLGDHLDVSKDSRSLGYIKQDAIEGTLSMKW